MHDDFDPEDSLPALRAQLDQAIAIAPEIARTASGFFRAFSAEGFTDGQALYLTACQLHSTPGNGPGG